MSYMRRDCLGQAEAEGGPEEPILGPVGAVAAHCPPPSVGMAPSAFVLGISSGAAAGEDLSLMGGECQRGKGPQDSRSCLPRPQGGSSWPPLPSVNVPHGRRSRGGPPTPGSY